MDILNVQVQCSDKSMRIMPNLQNAYVFAISEALRGAPIIKMMFDVNGIEYRFMYKTPDIIWSDNAEIKMETMNNDYKIKKIIEDFWIFQEIYDLSDQQLLIIKHNPEMKEPIKKQNAINAIQMVLSHEQFKELFGID